MSKQKFFYANMEDYKLEFNMRSNRPNVEIGELVVRYGLYSSGYPIDKVIETGISGVIKGLSHHAVKLEETDAVGTFLGREVHDVYVSEGSYGKSIELKVDSKGERVVDIIDIMHENLLEFDYEGVSYNCVGFHKNPESDMVTFYFE